MERIETLQQLGLGEYAARTYLALLETGTATARDASAQAKVPMGKIYRALEELQHHGLVTVHPENPKRYEPTSIDALITRRQQEQKARIQELETQRDDLRRAFPITGSVRPTTGLGDVTLKKGRFHLVQVFGDLLKTAHRDYLAVCGPGFLPWWRMYAEDLERARTRNVTQRFLLPREQAADPEMTELARHVQVRLYERPTQALGANSMVIVADRRRAFLASFLDDASAGARDVGLLTDQEGLVGSVEVSVEALWLAARPHPLHERAPPRQEPSRSKPTARDRERPR